MRDAASQLFEVEEVSSMGCVEVIKRESKHPEV
jgi:hypothetical protein